MEATATKMKLKRYPAYVDSGVAWIGEIPEGWERRKLKHLFYEKKKITNPELNCGSISFGKVVLKDDGKVPESTKRSYQEVLTGEFLINPLNLNYDLISLRIGLSEIDVVVSSGYIVLTNAIDLNKTYFKWLLHIYDIAYMKLLGSGVRQTISFNHISDSILPLPPLATQTRIAAFLDEKTSQIEKAIAQKEKLIELLKERKQIMIQQAVTRGLNPDSPMKDSGVEWIGQIPAHWEVKRLRYIGVCQNGISKGGDAFGSGFPFVNYGDVYKNEKLPFEFKGLVESSRTERQQFSVKEGDVFFTRTSETAEEIAFTATCFQTIKDATFAGFLIRFRPNSGLLVNGFSKYFFRNQSLRGYFVGNMNIVIRASLSQELLKKLPVFLPPLKEQSDIASFLDNQCGKIERLLISKQNEIEKLKELKTTLINSAVTGKIKI